MIQMDSQVSGNTRTLALTRNVSVSLFDAPSVLEAGLTMTYSSQLAACSGQDCQRANNRHGQRLLLARDDILDPLF